MLDRIRTVTVVLATAIAASLTACAGSEPSGDVAAGPAQEPAMAVAIDDGGFRPHEIDVGPGETVTIEVRNDDSTEHDFAIPALDLNTGVIEPGRLATARFEAPATATDFVCTLHPSMKGALVPRGWMPNLRSPRSAIGIEPKKGRDLDARIETRREEVAGRQS